MCQKLYYKFTKGVKSCKILSKKCKSWPKYSKKWSRIVKICQKLSSETRFFKLKICLKFSKGVKNVKNSIKLYVKVKKLDISKKIYIDSKIYQKFIKVVKNDNKSKKVDQSIPKL